VESKIYGDGPKCCMSLARSYFQYAPVKRDVSQWFTYMGSKTWSIGLLEIFGFLTLLIAISGDHVLVSSFSYDRGKMVTSILPSCPFCSLSVVLIKIVGVKQDLHASPYLYGEHSKNVALM